MHLKCNYCGLQRWRGIIQMKHHLAGTHGNIAPCKKCPDRTIVQSICRFLYGHALPFVLVKSPLFASMMEMVGDYGRGLKLSSYHETRVIYFKKEVDNVNSMLDKYKKEWKRTGCTLMPDGWTDRKSKSLTNFLVNSPSGTIFLNSMNISDVIKDAQRLFELLNSLVEEIGEESVAQVVTDSASVYVAAGDLLMKKRTKLFCSPSKSHYANNVLAILTCDDKFWKLIEYCLKCVSPLVKVLKLVDGDVKPTRYEHIWKIIDTRWDLQLHRPLHAAGYFLNPKKSIYMKIGLYKTIEKIYPDIETRIKIDNQLEKFKKREGLFSMSMVVLTRDKKQPACTKNGFNYIYFKYVLAMEENAKSFKITFEHVHSKNRNSLGQQRLNALVFIKYNIQLELRQVKREERGETYDLICLSNMDTDDEWITELEKPCNTEEEELEDIVMLEDKDNDEGIDNDYEDRYDI
uniref:DUF659 domain-containing protein n=1 Tax=Manihot esculenta TaxID=3983 RepID=A0A2C9VYB7_MANES